MLVMVTSPIMSVRMLFPFACVVGCVFWPAARRVR